MQNKDIFGFLKEKTMYYKKFDYTVVESAWKILEPHIKTPYVIHLIGTNGKGSTGRFIALMLKENSKSVLHYTSPHIQDFNERIWINGENVSNRILENVHSFFLSLFPNTLLNKLTYFEYTTLIALYLSKDVEYLVLEAGLGGEFDATNVIENDLSVIPTIGYDHMEFLGNTLEEIATTKLKSCNNAYIFGNNMPNEVLGLKQTILKDKKEILLYEKTIKAYKDFPQYLQNNLRLALSVISFLGFDTEKKYALTSIEGRYEKIAPNIILDVGHNPLSALMIKEELGTKKINLIYNSYRDKSYQKILEILKNNIKTLYILECFDERMVEKNLLLDVAKRLNIMAEEFQSDKIDENEDYLIYGSFKVVEEFKRLFS